MEFFNFLKKESQDFDRRMIMAGAFAGVVNTLLIFILTAAAIKASSKQSIVRELALVIISLGAYWWSKGYLMRKTAYIVEEIMERTRWRIADKLRSADVSSFEGLGSAPFHNVISTHSENISRGSTGTVSALSSLTLVICAFIVIYFLSSTACLILIATLGLIILIFMSDRVRILASMEAVSAHENKVVKTFGDLFSGFKELKMNSAKNRDFFDVRLRPDLIQARDLRTACQLSMNQSVLLATSALFILLAGVVFLVPVLAPADAPKLARIVTIVVFMFGPLGEIIGVYPYFAQAVASIREISRIEDQLNTLLQEGHADPIPSASETLTFNSIQCQHLTFGYRGEKGESVFSLDPFDFHLSRGELVFITGGNGSGKSTFLKILAGLYAPAEGFITVDDKVVGPHNRQSYRDLFSAVFSDHHLFDYLYGIQQVNPDRVNELLHLTDLLEKTSVSGRQITQINLSAGQKKRLALVVALLEDKPIFLFDEWAAEQDPLFRRKFYRQILPSLKEKGKTIVAVTHDDDYYDVADRVLKMQYGKFLPPH